MVESNLQRRCMAVISYFILGLFALICLLPFVMIISASVSSESSLVQFGYGIWPKEFSLEAYKQIVARPKTVLDAYKLTIIVTVVGSFCRIMLESMAAYALSRKNYVLRKFVNVYFFITMIFHAGMVPSYILLTKYYHLSDNPLALILPGMFGAYHVFILRTYFKQTSESIIEAAKIDGLGEIQIFLKIVMPICKTGVATILLMTIMNYWNSWYECLMYMTDDRYITLQYYLTRTMSNIDQILKNQGTINESMAQLPTETTRMAMCVLAAGPMVVIFMFFQKYFVKGISVGSVKG